jgi:hypothetical protein
MEIRIEGGVKWSDLWIISYLHHSTFRRIVRTDNSNRWGLTYTGLI